VRTVAFSEDYATVGARRDVDGAYFELVVQPDRGLGRGEDGLELVFSPAAARRLTRELNRWLRVTKELS
jgi:hypothetical protein